MDKSKKLSNEELGMVDGSTLYISIDGGKKTRAIPGCSGGMLTLNYRENGVEKSFDTGVPIGGLNIFGTLLFTGLAVVESQTFVEYTYNVSSKADD